MQFFSVFYYIFRHHFCHLYFTFYFCPPIWRCLDHYRKHKQVHLNTHTWSTCMVPAHNPILNSAWKHPDFFLNMDAKEYKIKDTGKQQTLNFTSLLSRNHSNSFYIYSPCLAFLLLSSCTTISPSVKQLKIIKSENYLTKKLLAWFKHDKMKINHSFDQQVTSLQRWVHSSYWKACWAKEIFVAIWNNGIWVENKFKTPTHACRYSLTHTMQNPKTLLMVEVLKKEMWQENDIMINIYPGHPPSLLPVVLARNV